MPKVGNAEVATGSSADYSSLFWKLATYTTIIKNLSNSNKLSNSPPLDNCAYGVWPCEAKISCSSLQILAQLVKKDTQQIMQITTEATTDCATPRMLLLFEACEGCTFGTRPLPGPSLQVQGIKHADVISDLASLAACATIVPCRFRQGGV